MAEITKTSQLSKGIYVSNCGSGPGSIITYSDLNLLYVGNKKVKSVWCDNTLVWSAVSVSLKLTYNIILDCVAQMQLSIVLSSNVDDFQCAINTYECTSSSHTDSITDIKAISTEKIYCLNNNLTEFQPCGVNLGTSSLSYQPTISVDYNVFNYEYDMFKYYSTTLNPTIIFPTLNYTNYIYLRLYNSSLNASTWWDVDYILLVGTYESNDLGDQEYTIGNDFALGSLGVAKISSNMLPFGLVSNLNQYQLISANTELVCFNKMLVCRIPRSKKCLVVDKEASVMTGGGATVYNCLVNTTSTPCSNINYINLFYKVSGIRYKRLCVIPRSTNYVYGTLNDIKRL